MKTDNRLVAPETTRSFYFLPSVHCFGMGSDFNIFNHGVFTELHRNIKPPAAKNKKLLLIIFLFPWYSVLFRGQYCIFYHRFFTESHRDIKPPTAEN